MEGEDIAATEEAALILNESNLSLKKLRTRPLSEPIIHSPAVSILMFF